MENKVELKETDIEFRACCYFDDIIKDRDSDLVDILLDEKIYENILVSGI